MKAMILNSKIFRAYDIRGIAFQDFDEDGFFSIAQGFAQYVSEKLKIKNPKIFVSGDGRLSLEQLSPSLLSGLEARGARVTWGGSIPTPLNYFAFHEGKFDAAIQITASHNPSEYNGLKLLDRNGAVCGEEIQKIMRMSLGANFEPPCSPRSLGNERKLSLLSLRSGIRKLAECSLCRDALHSGKCKNECTPVSFLEKYEKKLRGVTTTQKLKKIVVDCGNGIPGLFYPDILKNFGHHVTSLHCSLDTTFPHHQPDPERPENLKDLIKKVKELHADFGFSFDGDGDRVGIILSDGAILSADKILFILASDFLSRHPKSPVVLDAMTSATLMEKIKSLDGSPILSRTGHSYIEEKMKASGALLGGEQSGHFMLGENFYGHDDALLAALRFLGAVEKNPKLLAEVTKKWPKLSEFSEKFDAPDEKKFEILKIVETRLIASLPKDVKVSTLDGVRLDYGEGEWAIVRCSNTAPKIAVRIEAKTKKSLEEKKKMILSLLKKNSKN